MGSTIHIVLTFASFALSLILSWFTLVTIKENKLLKMQNELLTGIVSGIVSVLEKDFFSHETNNEEDEENGN